MSEQRDVQTGTPGEQSEPPAEKPQTAEEPQTADKPPMSEETASLMGLIDRLTSLLERSDLDELEVEAGETAVVLRKPSALLPVGVTAVAATQVAADAPGSENATKTADAAAVSTTRFVKAPLTGVFYLASSPGAPAYVMAGQQITVGHVIGLIEAMKLFNEIKSDTAGRVIRVVAETGKLVKAKQPLIEVEPE
jgi:acetyl-CoA carboxylase biotin carboxyl carrier protein